MLVFNSPVKAVRASGLPVSSSDPRLETCPVLGDSHIAMSLRQACMLAEPRAMGGTWLVKVRDVLKMLNDDGWRLARQRGSHRQLKHPSKGGLVTVAGKLSDELAPGTLNSILKQAGLRP